jgi:hypothetical protein
MEQLCRRETSQAPAMHKNAHAAHLGRNSDAVGQSSELPIHTIGKSHALGDADGTHRMDLKFLRTDPGVRHFSLRGFVKQIPGLN